MSQIIAIQGIKGSYHHLVVQNYFGSDTAIKACNSFQEVADMLVNNRCSYAVMAIENSIAGSILPNYMLIDENQLEIQGEYYLSIQHALLALPNQEISEIKEVWSHPMALLQCKVFLRNYPNIKLVEDTDTAAAAQNIIANNRKGIAAIASEQVTQLYPLSILRKNIQTIPDNSTRFFILGAVPSLHTKENKTITPNKASLKFITDHKRGSLAAVLNVMRDCKLNLTKIQSLPVPETPWKYAFFADVAFESYLDYQKALSILKIMAVTLKVLGEYQNANMNT